MERYFLDTGVLGLVTHPSGKPEVIACKKWFQRLLEEAVPVHVPEIADYELRRKLLQIGSSKALTRLDELKAVVQFVPITTPAMLKAAQYWADARRRGQPTAADEALDGDVILAAQATTAVQDPDTVIVVTTNVAHLSRFVSAALWTELDQPAQG